MDTTVIDQRIREIERKISARQTELANVNSQIGSKNSDLENEQRALKQSQQSYDHNARLQREGRAMNSSFDSGIRKQKEAITALGSITTAFVGLAIGQRLNKLIANDSGKIKQRIDWSLQDIASKLRQLDETIRRQNQNIARFKSDIANLRQRRDYLNYQEIPGLQAELRRLRQQKAMGGV